MIRRLLPIITVSVLGACGTQDQGMADHRSEGLVIGGTDAGAEPASIYQMPAPNEIFRLVRELPGHGQQHLLNPRTSADRYVSRKARAVNFGIYLTDLVYASTFGLHMDAVHYYGTTREMADELGISNAFAQADLTRLEQNITLPDSLEAISNNIYLKAYEKMEMENMGPTMALSLAGGWIECMHLLTRQTEMFGNKEGTFDRLAEQKVTLDQLLAIMELQANDEDVASVRNDLVRVRDVYETLPVRPLPKHDDSSDRLIIGSESDLQMTASDHERLKAAISAVREKLTRPEDELRS